MTDTPRNFIRSLAELTERLEALRADLDPRRLTLAEYEQVGWALRPVEALLDQARQETRSNRAQERLQSFARVLPKGPRVRGALL